MSSSSGLHVRAQESNSSNAVNGSKPIGENVAKRLEVVEWLNSIFPSSKLSLEATEEELRAFLKDGTIFYIILYNLHPGLIPKNQGVSSGKSFDIVNKFLSVMEEMGLPGFDALDLEKGSMSAVVECLLALRDHMDSKIRDTKSPTKFGRQLRRWRLPEVENLEGTSGARGDLDKSSPGSGEERRKSLLDAKSQRILRSPVASEPLTALSNHGGHIFHEVFQLKQGRYSDIPAAKISEMMKSNSLDNAPTQSLLSVVNGVLDESIERKNGELPQRVACLLRRVVQEIERRISTQAEHIRNQNNVIKAREEKYQSRIRVLETLAMGTSEESQIVMNQLRQIQTEKLKLEEGRKPGEQDVMRLMKEKENSDLAISALKEELEKTKMIYEERCSQLEKETREAKMELKEKLKENNDLATSALKEELKTTEKTYEERFLQLEKQAKESNDSKLVLEAKLKEVECLLTESRNKTKELGAASASEILTWNRKEQSYQNFISLEVQALQELRVASGYIKKTISNAQSNWQQEFNMLGKKLHGITNAVENYHTVLSENRRLYNEVQDLKGKIRVYCRIRPFLPGQTGKQSTIEHIGDDGELVVANPSKQGKEGRRMFKFNKVFGQAASQEEVFLDTQPLIRSVLDGYNVCIFAYGQTGSGKTYTMTGPDVQSKETWGVNYRALNDLFYISQNRKSTFLYEVGVQMVEIYNEQVRDLLGNGFAQKRLGICSTTQPNGLAVPDASMHTVNSTTDVLELMQIGHMNRTVGSTALNVRSSRSHSVLTVHVRSTNLESGAGLRGSLHLVDLAGSERADRSEATGERLKEAQHINKSLSALGDVIFALAQKSPHVPYRNSKLTQVLQSSLGGQAKTLMFVQLNPDLDSYSETVSTLKFAERVSGIELGASRSNKEGKDVRELMDQVASLKDTIAKKDEEIEQLQLLKDLKTQSPIVNGEKRATKLLSHSSSSPSLPSSPAGPTRRSRSLSSGRGTRPIDKPASDQDNFSEHSDKHSESSSQHSLDDFRHEKEILGQSKLTGAETGPFPVDIEAMGFSNVGSEERLSDTSDGHISMGAEPDGSAELTLSTEGVKPAETTEKTIKVSSQIPRPTQKSTQTTSTRVATKVPSKGPTGLRKAAATSATTSSTKASSRRFQ